MTKKSKSRVLGVAVSCCLLKMHHAQIAHSSTLNNYSLLLLKLVLLYLCVKWLRLPKMNTYISLQEYEMYIRKHLPENNFNTMLAVLQKFFNFMTLTSAVSY